MDPPELPLHSSDGGRYKRAMGVGTRGFRPPAKGWASDPEDLLVGRARHAFEQHTTWLMTYPGSLVTDVSD